AQGPSRGELPRSRRSGQGHGLGGPAARDGRGQTDTGGEPLRESLAQPGAWGAGIYPRLRHRPGPGRPHPGRGAGDAGRAFPAGDGALTAETIVRRSLDLNREMNDMTYRFSRLRRQAEGWRRGLLLCSVVAGLAAPLAAMADTPPLRVAIAEDALTLDPIASSDNASIWAELLIYDQLVRPSVDGTKLEPDLAEKWSVSPDGLEYTFTLRDAKFANGDPVTAEGV